MILNIKIKIKNNIDIDKAIRIAVSKDLTYEKKKSKLRKLKINDVEGFIGNIKEIKQQWMQNCQPNCYHN